MARNRFRQDIEELKNALEQLQVVANVDTPVLAGKIDFRKNILADYTAAFSSDFLDSGVLALIAHELEDEILLEMRKDRRTARLADGLEGKLIGEKRRGVWKQIPKARVETRFGEGFRTPLVGSQEAPIRIEIFPNPDHDGVTLTVQLQSPLYIVMHSGTRPHDVPPIGQYHVFPTQELIARRPEAAYSKYGPQFFNLRSVPWRDAGGPRTEVSYEQDAQGHGRRRMRPVRLKGLTTHLPSPGFEPGVPFVTISWRRVIRRNRNRTQQTITRRMLGRNII